MSNQILQKVSPMTKARAELVMADPFFGILALRMKMKEDATCETAWCDGVTIGYNPKYISKLSPEQRRGLLVHEIMHPALLHHTRRGNREPRKWNMAADYALNPLISKRYKLPDGALESPAFANMSAEEIYNKLPDLPPGAGGDPGGCGEVRDNPGTGDPNQSKDQSNKQSEAEWKQSLAQARHVAKMQGKLPAELDKMVDDALEPVVDWKNQLRRFVSEKARDDESWNKANRRFIGDDLYLPSRDSEKVGVLAVFRDTSGSIYADPEALAQFNGEIEAIAIDVNPAKIVVVDCDADVQHTFEIEPGQDMPEALRELKGGGGTDFRPPFKWLKEQNIDPKCVVYLTDGYGDFPREEDVPWPTMWAMTTDVEAPFGEIVRLA
jgi:predicted metal-dependent peptidase